MKGISRFSSELASIRENPQILEAVSNSATFLISIFLHLISSGQFRSVHLTTTENSAKYVKILVGVFFCFFKLNGVLKCFIWLFTFL